jgi:PAS domain S-box-containing protein
LTLETAAEESTRRRATAGDFALAALDEIPLASARGVSGEITGEPEEQEANRRLAAIVESSDDAIISKDLNGVIKTWNKSAERIFGYRPEEVIGKSVTILIPEGRLDEEPTILGRIRKGERTDHYETVRRRKDGTLVDISLTVSPIKDTTGRVVGASKIARDITVRKRAEAELHAAREELARLNADLETRVRERTASLTEAIAHLEEFSYTVSHDLRAPVRAMRRYAEIALKEHGPRLEAGMKEYLERIIRGGARMDRLVQDVLTYSRVSRVGLTLGKVNVEGLVQDIIDQFPRMQTPQAQIKIRRPLEAVRAHEASLGQALSNLLANAVKFVPAGEVPRVVVRTERRGPRVRVWVEDQGIGIAPEHQNRAFGVFERLHPELGYEGTGIGLAIVRKVTERMEGTVGVESDGLNGSRFWIELPAAKIYDREEPKPVAG